MKKLLIFLTALLLASITLAQEEKQETMEMKPALLVIDVQKQFMPMMSQDDQEMAITMMNWAIWIFRKYDLPVIRVYHTSPEWGPAEDSPGFAFHDSLKLTKNDPMIVKTYASAFTKTDLDKLLKEKDINTLFMCGLSSVGCVLATYMDAQSHDYKAFMLKDAMLSHDEKYTNNVEEMFNAMDLETLMYMIEVSRK
ncbi:MAG: isochorismatase family cysteine hydrolase [Bacteroidales bacterium]|jgi:nicotinamidase-related amidase|nr:isochorismatase family cysteine hydrolase [Bacteroidales bacterium]